MTKSNKIPKDLEQQGQISMLVLKCKSKSKIDLSHFHSLEELILHDLKLETDISLPSQLKKIKLINSQTIENQSLDQWPLPPNLTHFSLKNCLCRTLLLPPTFQSLVHLSVINCQTEQIRNIENLAKVSSLNLSQNHLESLPIELGGLDRLRRLVLDSNRFQTLPTAVFALKNLEHLGVDNNQFADSEKERIATSFGIMLN
jgi:Leucine-rich repeat (LRR) protein